MRNYYYNTYIDMYCVCGTTFASDDLNDLTTICGEMEEIEMPDYITEDYGGIAW